MLIHGPFHVIVNHEKSLWNMIKAGKYDWHANDINTCHFSVQDDGQGQVELNIELVKYDQAIESNYVVYDLSKHGLRPVTLSEFLALGAQHPDLQRDNPIVCLSSGYWSWGVGRVVPQLDGDGSSRNLRLFCTGDEWYSRCRFAAVRIKK